MPSNLHIERFDPLISSRALKEELPLTAVAAETVDTTVEALLRILNRLDRRRLVVVGPCSIHDLLAAMEFARRLALLAGDMSDRLLILMRTFFEKPRSRLGWPGLIVDPHMDGSNDGAEGLRLARRLLLEINGLGLGTAMEMIDPFVPNYIDDLISFATLGARSIESSAQRRMATGLSMPVGGKNGTDGNVKDAIDALVAAQYPHSFFGTDEEGRAAVVHTTGNPDGVVILRGGRNGPNCDTQSIMATGRQMEEEGLRPNVVVDYNHANSGGNPREQERIWRQGWDQLSQTGNYQIGFMAEAFLHEGKQKINIPVDRAKLQYGVSVTDACWSWETTERMLEYAYDHAI